MPESRSSEAVVIGSGFGGATVALELARAGIPVTVLERGDWVARDSTAWDPQAILIDGRYKSATPFETDGWLGRRLLYANQAVGGNSVFYGAASFRLREADFEPRPGLPPWPIRYSDLEPYYDQAEELLGVLGVAGADPTEPPRRRGYSAAPPPYSAMAARVARAAEMFGLHAFPIPLAINFHGNDGRAQCERCLTCDLFPCKIGAKNDLSLTAVPEALRHGAVVQPHTVARRLIMDGTRVTGVECVDVVTRRAFIISSRLCVVSCGAIGSAALLLASGIGALEPNGRLVGRYLMRHCSGIVIGLLPEESNPDKAFHKQVAITDFYFGDGGTASGKERMGLIQGLQVPPPEWILAEAPFPVNRLGAATVNNHIYLLCLAEDVPQWENRIEIDQGRCDRFGAPMTRVVHRYERRDLRARRALYHRAARILRAAGAWIRVRKPINTFSHALGTGRFGEDPQDSVLDRWCRVHGVSNLFVVDGSFMPTSGAVNPSLTIAANGLRVGQYLCGAWERIAAGKT